MTTHKHTPGPWECVNSPNVDNCYVVRTTIGHVAIAAAADVSLDPRYGWDKLNKADAHLMAAAPDLLEACEAALLSMMNSSGLLMINSIDELNEDLIESVLTGTDFEAESLRLWQAIKKARGE